MSKAKPIFDLGTHYRLDVQGRINAEWLQGFGNSAEVRVCETEQREEITVLDVHTDQSGLVGLVRRLHGLGITILQLQIVSNGGVIVRPKNNPKGRAEPTSS